MEGKVVAGRGLVKSGGVVMGMATVAAAVMEMADNAGMQLGSLVGALVMVPWEVGHMGVAAMAEEERGAEGSVVAEKEEVAWARGGLAGLMEAAVATLAFQPALLVGSLAVVVLGAVGTAWAKQVAVEMAVAVTAAATTATAISEELG